MTFASQLLQYETNLRSLAFYLTGSAARSEDLIQETYYRALRNEDKYQQGTNLKAWLSTIMRNIFINDYHKKKVVQPIGDGDREVRDTYRTEINSSYRNFLSQEISHAMETVNSDFTKPFLMYFSGFQYQEIAEQLHLPIGTVKSRIHSARKELQTRLRAMGIENAAYLN